MTQRYSFPTGLNQIAVDWLTGTLRWALTTAAYSPDPSVDVYMTAVAPFELTDGSYARVTATTKSRTSVLPASAAAPGYVVFDCADPSFGVIFGGEIAEYLILFDQNTNDVNSPIVAALPIYYTANGVDVAAFAVNPTFGAVAISTVCPGEF